MMDLDENEILALCAGIIPLVMWRDGLTEEEALAVVRRRFGLQAVPAPVTAPPDLAPAATAPVLRKVL